MSGELGLLSSFCCSDLFLCKYIVNFPNSTTYITCPADPKKTLGIKLPFLIMIIKNLRKYFTFEVQVGHACMLYNREAVLRVLNYKQLILSFGMEVILVTQAFSLL